MSEWLIAWATSIVIAAGLVFLVARKRGRLRAAGTILLETMLIGIIELASAMLAMLERTTDE